MKVGFIFSSTQNGYMPVEEIFDTFDAAECTARRYLREQEREAENTDDYYRLYGTAFDIRPAVQNEDDFDIFCHYPIAMVTLDKTYYYKIGAKEVIKEGE